MNININLDYSDRVISSVLYKTKTIAIIGLSSSWNRPSYFVAKYLIDRGYKIYPINPKEAGKKILGQKVYSNITEIKDKIDMVDVFRKSSDIDKIIEDILACNPQFIWLQIGVINNKLAKVAANKNIPIIMNRCPKIEYSRLSGELGWGGINSGNIINKRRIIKPVAT
ncbi:MAG: CoA-binding protein [Rickettsiales bacterium]|nr:CoA-binding protein [Rickettsiales bacterium]|tara:strand:- start:758 stop:1261 length:504 start_codon:yes stop_codon:yes gene_type:complete